MSAGVTTGVDAGSAGFLNYGAMKDYVFPAHRTRLLAFLQIGAVGLAANRILGGGLQDMRVIDVDRTADAIKANPGFFFGVKVRMHLGVMAMWHLPPIFHWPIIRRGHWRMSNNLSPVIRF